MRAVLALASIFANIELIANSLEFGGGWGEWFCKYQIPARSAFTFVATRRMEPRTTSAAWPGFNSKVHAGSRYKENREEFLATPRTRADIHWSDAD
jgi:hypothetical protein